jgi:bifunctional DNase/RNase
MTPYLESTPLIFLKKKKIIIMSIQNVQKPRPVLHIILNHIIQKFKKNENK